MKRHTPTALAPSGRKNSRHEPSPAKRAWLSGTRPHYCRQVSLTLPAFLFLPLHSHIRGHAQTFPFSSPTRPANRHRSETMPIPSSATRSRKMVSAQLRYNSGILHGFATLRRVPAVMGCACPAMGSCAGGHPIKYNEFNCFIFAFILQYLLPHKVRYRVLLRLFSHCKGKTWAQMNRQRLCKVRQSLFCKKSSFYCYAPFLNKRVFWGQKSCISAPATF